MHVYMHTSLHKQINECFINKMKTLELRRLRNWRKIINNFLSLILKWKREYFICHFFYNFNNGGIYIPQVWEVLYYLCHDVGYYHATIRIM